MGEGGRRWEGEEREEGQRRRREERKEEKGRGRGRRGRGGGGRGRGGGDESIFPLGWELLRGPDRPHSGGHSRDGGWGWGLYRGSRRRERVCHHPRQPTEAGGDRSPLTFPCDPRFPSTRQERVWVPPPPPRPPLHAQGRKFRPSSSPVTLENISFLLIFFFPF